MKLAKLPYEILRTHGDILRHQSLLVAVSGGLDSVVLLDVLFQIRGRLGLELSVAHAHHGEGGTATSGSTQTSGPTERDRALEFVREIAERYGLAFHFRRADSALKSEADFRKFRRRALEEMASGQSVRKIALGHHANDLFETRLMRLIRGTGARGLTAMVVSNEKTVRPLLHLTRAQILAHANENKLKWLNDSSNTDSRFFRNWIRHEWLPLLEHKQTGATASFGRSLDLIAESMAESMSDAVQPAFRPEQKLVRQMNRLDFHLLNATQKRARLSDCTFEIGAKDFSRAKIIEVLKRLDHLEAHRQARAEFRVGGIQWHLSPTMIEAFCLEVRREAT